MTGYLGRFATAQREGNAWERMPVRHLVRFMEPVALKDLPGRRDGGYWGPRWALFAAIEDFEGTLVSPGRGIHWVCTEKGMAICSDYLAREVEAAARAEERERRFRAAALAALVGT